MRISSQEVYGGDECWFVAEIIVIFVANCVSSSLAGFSFFVLLAFEVIC